MTKGEVLKTIRNHSGEIKMCLFALDLQLFSLVRGCRNEVPGEINSLKDMMKFIKSKTDDIKNILNEWPK